MTGIDLGKRILLIQFFFFFHRVFFQRNDRDVELSSSDGRGVGAPIQEEIKPIRGVNAQS